MNTKNLAIMSTDIVASSVAAAAFNRAEYQQFRSQYEQILIPIIERSSGEVFKALGDGYLASFESSTNAVLAGLDIQAQLKSFFATQQLDQRCSTRIGIGSGDVTIEGADRFGQPVIQATRVQGIADPWSTFITESVFLTMNRNEVQCEDLGYISLKGLEDKTRVFKVQPKGAAGGGDELAILCTDLAQATASVGAAHYEEALASYDQVVFQHALSLKGFLRYNLGDMYLVSFRSAADALAAAEGMLLALRRLPFFQCQLGLDYGYVRSVKGRLYGYAISQVAPALAHARNEKIVASKAFVEQLTKERPGAPPLRSDEVLQVNIADYRPVDAVGLIPEDA